MAFSLASGDLWISFSNLSLGPNEKLFVRRLWGVFSLVEQRDEG